VSVFECPLNIKYLHVVWHIGYSSLYCVYLTLPDYSSEQ